MNYIFTLLKYPIEGFWMQGWNWGQLGKSYQHQGFGCNSLIFLINTKAYFFPTFIVMMIVMRFFDHLYRLCYIIYVSHVLIICMVVFLHIFSWNIENKIKSFNKPNVRTSISNNVWTIHPNLHLWFNGNELYEMFLCIWLFCSSAWFPTLGRLFLYTSNLSTKHWKHQITCKHHGHILSPAKL